MTEQQQTEPTRAAVAVVDGDGWSVGYADLGVRGYTPTTYAYETHDQAHACARTINEALGLTPERVAEIVLSSMAVAR